jgi:hypothetical protein
MKEVCGSVRVPLTDPDPEGTKTYRSGTPRRLRQYQIVFVCLLTCKNIQNDALPPCPVQYPVYLTLKFIFKYFRSLLLMGQKGRRKGR